MAISVSENQQEAGFWRKAGGVGAGFLTYGIAPNLSLKFFSPKCMERMIKLNQSLSADEVKLLHSAGNQILEKSGLTAKGVVKQLGMTEADEKTIFAPITKLLDKFNISKDVREKILENNPVKKQLTEGKNAFFEGKLNKIFMPKNGGMELAQFHEIGHALNYNMSKVGKFLQKAIFFTPMLATVALFTALFKNKKAEGEKPTGWWDKTTTFVKNHAGKLAVAGMLPLVIEEAMATYKGEKFASKIPELGGLMKKIKASNRWGLATYVALTAAMGLGVMLAGKVRDAIIQPKANKA